MVEIAPFSFDHSFDFSVPRSVLWDALQRTDEYPDWWAWLRGFEVNGANGRGGGLYTGTTADCLVRGPIPYAVAFTVTLDEVVPCSMVRASVSRDLEGPATLELGDAPGGSRARLSWEVHMRDPALRAAAAVARPVLIWGHDTIVVRGVRQFVRHGLERTGEASF